MFQKRFAYAVGMGDKVQTIRPPRKGKPFFPGEPISLRVWTGLPYRSLQQQIARAEVIRVTTITIEPLHLNLGEGASGAAERHDLDAFARRDGFRSWPELTAWFRETHGLPFCGELIKWRLEE
jgi:hypothetical protein